MITCLLALSILAADPAEYKIPIGYMSLETDGNGEATAFILSGNEGKPQRFYANSKTKVLINDKKSSLSELFEVVRKADKSTVQATITTKEKGASLALSIKTKP